MGTTLDAIKSGNCRLVTVVQIGGYDKLLTDAESTLHSTVQAAYTATDVSAARHSGVKGGLEVDYGDLSQSFTPWSSELKSTSVRLMVHDGGGGFAEIIHKRGGISEYEVTEAIDTTETVFDVKQASDFSGLSSNADIWLDNECCQYSSQTSTTVTVNKRGVYAPFKAESETYQRWAQVHELPEVGFDVTYGSMITQEPVRWIGRHVAVRLHRMQGDTADTYDQAHLIFAGVIDDIRDTPDGKTEIICSDFRKVINEAVIFNKQYKALPEQGMYVPAGWKFNVTYWDRSTGNRHSTVGTAEELEVVSSGASGTNQINAGTYTPAGLGIALNLWQNGLSTYTAPTPNFHVLPDHTEIKFYSGSGSDGDWGIFEAPAAALELLGWINPQRISNTDTDDLDWAFVRGEAGSDELISIKSDGPALERALPTSSGGDSSTAEMEISKGTWINQQAYMPEPWRTRYSMSGGNWGVVRYGERYYLAEYTSDTELTLWADDDLQQALGGAVVREAGKIGQRRGESDMLVEQVMFIERGFVDMIAMLFLATDGANYNDSSGAWDTMPLGAAIPYELLGDTFINSLKAVAGATAGGKMTVLIDKPTKLVDIIGADMVLRQADLIFDPGDGAYRMTVPITPTSAVSSSLLTGLTESNKGAPLDASNDPQRTTTEITSAYLRNVVKVEYNRTSVKDDYRDSVTVINQASVNGLGRQQTVTVKARNTWGGTAVADTVTELASSIAASLLPMLGEPLRLYRRTINQTLCDLVPGDLVLVTDEYIRDPETGTRGVTQKPGVVWSSHWSPGGASEAPTGECQVIFADYDRVKTLTPCANVDDTATNAGYDAGTKTLTCYAHHYSDSSEAADASHFVAGDAVIVVQRGLDWTAPAVTWADTVASQSGNTITLTTGDSGSWDNSLYYRVIYDEYNNCSATQKANFAFVGDETTGQVYGDDPSVYGDYVTTVPVVNDDWDGPTLRPEHDYYYYSQYGGGMSPMWYLNLSRYVANMNSYRCAQQFMFLYEGYRATATNNSVYEALMYMPLNLGTFPYQSRSVTLAPIVSNDSGSHSGTLRVTFTREPRTKSGLGLTDLTFKDPVVQQTWTIAAGDSKVIQSDKTVKLLSPNTPDQCIWMFWDWLGGGSGTCTFHGLAKAWVGAP